MAAAWIPFFDDMDAIIFLAPLSPFDQVLEEDPSVGRLVRGSSLPVLRSAQRLTRSFVHIHAGSPPYVRKTGYALTSTLAWATVAAAGRLSASVEVGRVEPAARADEHRALSEQVRHPDGEAQGGCAVRAVHHVVRDTPERLRIGVYLCVRLPSILFLCDVVSPVSRSPSSLSSTSVSPSPSLVVN